MKATYNDNPNKNYKLTIGLDKFIKIRMHVFEPDESLNKEDWYKDMTTFNNCELLNFWNMINIGDVVEDDTGARFRILSRHWKWEKDENNNVTPVIEFTSERYIRHGKQNPYMI